MGKKVLKRDLDDLIDPDTRELLPSNDREFQKAVIERDNEACIFSYKNFICMHSPVCAHHIIPRRYKKSRHDPINGVALCLACHAWAHSKPKISEARIITYLIERGIVESIEKWEEYKRGVIS